MEVIKNKLDANVKIGNIIDLYNKENSNAVCNLNSVVHLYNSAKDKEVFSNADEKGKRILNQYKDIPEHVINSIQRIIKLNQEVRDELLK